MDSILIVNIGLVIANLFLVYLTFRQVRYLQRPIIVTKMIPYLTSIDTKPSVLVTGSPYLAVSNISSNRATNLKINCQIKLNTKMVAHFNQDLTYLNPSEATEIAVPLDIVVKNNPDLFEQIEEDKETKIIPKKTLRFFLEAIITHGFPRIKLCDSYKMEWGSLESYPQFKDHPKINCWNFRDGLYIYKLRKTNENTEN
ncbi:hypothetical protein VLL09_04780 [Dehalococcoides mccartyi]|uniref:Uncharacterized protein n=1 Tax=Dehalococcoides mccartyi TaxID=61435 RepID=A0AB38Z804_9CHLR|nr:hypothetical protein [Dehalococcoides mccartyi]WRO06708.1 hypothetical protein VLL09_04780 [Dehalococcoides mccartyi]